MFWIVVVTGFTCTPVVLDIHNIAHGGVPLPCLTHKTRQNSYFAVFYVWMPLSPARAFWGRFDPQNGTVLPQIACWVNPLRLAIMPMVSVRICRRVSAMVSTDSPDVSL